VYPVPVAAPLEAERSLFSENPISSTDGSIGIRSVNTSTTGTTFNHLAAGSGDGSWLGSTGGVLRGWSTSSGSVSTGTTWLLLILLGGLLACGLGNGLSILLVLVDGPIEDIVILETLTDEEIAEDLSEVGVVGLVIEAEGASVVEVDGELVGEASAENFSWGGHLLLHDTVVLLLLGSSFQTLPWKRATAEVEHNISKRLHIITTRLLDTQVSVDGGITSSTSQVLVLTVWDVEVSLGVTVLLGQTEIDNVDLVSTLADTHEEVVRLDITVDEGLGVDVLDAGDELIGEEKDSLQGELSVAEVEEILQARSEKVENHSIVVTLSTEPADKWDADTTSKGLVDASLILQLWVLGLDRLQLNGNLLARDDVGSEVDITETSTTDLTTDAVFVADAKIQRVGFRLGDGWIHHSSHLVVDLWTLYRTSDTRVDGIEV